MPKPHAAVFFCSLLLLAILTAILIWWLGNPLTMAKLALASPIPRVLGTKAPGPSPTPAPPPWIPSDNQPLSALEDITGKAYLSYDLTTNQVILEKNSRAHLPMASLTKIMTAIIALENPQKNDIYYVHKRDLVGEDSMGLDANEKLSLKELLYGIILHSGNDAATVLADNFTGGINHFIQTMNEKVGVLGLSDTHFTNPTGLEGDGKQFTTAHDLMVITKYALTHFVGFAQVVSTPEYDIPQSSTHKEYYLLNETNLLTSYPGVKGVKTGYTPEAGLCLVTYLDYNDHKIIAVLLGSENRRSDMKEILDYSLKSLGVTPPPHD